VGKAIPVASLRLIQTAHETVGGRTLERPSCGGFMPTAETTLLPAYSATSKRSLTSSPRLDNEPNLIAVHVLSADKDDRNGLNGDDKNPGHGNRLSACEPLAPRVDFV
jgi:hypothetical protein